jgi:phosphotransferase system enzyme I (PtsP)
MASGKSTKGGKGADEDDKATRRRSVPPIAPVIFARGGEKRLDQLIDFVAFVAKPMPLTLLLDEAPRRISEIIAADIASLYLLEGDGHTLVLRGNVGFPLGARGTVRLSMGEGITGMAVEVMRPVAVATAPEHERFRAFPELEEDRYPVFLAVPIFGNGKALGALVVQRAERKFSNADIELAVALTAPIAAGIRHAQLLDETREPATQRRPSGGTRKVTLPGLPMVRGKALGAIAALRRPATNPLRKTSPDDAKQISAAFETAEKALGELVIRASELGLARESAFLSQHMLIVCDSRLRQRTFELVKNGESAAQALGLVAREAVRAANGIVGDPFLQDRARDIEDLCDALVMLASPDARAELPSKAVLIGEQLTVFDLLVSTRAQPVGVVLTQKAATPRARVLIELMGLPAIADVNGAFRWASPGDVALVDADHGLLVINPSRSEMATARAARSKSK